MRFLALLLVLATAATSLAAAEVRVVRVFTGWREATSFKRISEYFTGRENTGNEVVLRTQPASRGGYYFLVRTDNDGPARDARFILEVVTPGTTQPRQFEFNAALPAGNRVYQLGLTGVDWPDKTISAVAWKLELHDSAGALLATEKSYLWEKPTAK